jgi:hypothetical protein
MKTDDLNMSQGLTGTDTKGGKKGCPETLISPDTLTRLQQVPGQTDEKIKEV